MSEFLTNELYQFLFVVSTTYLACVVLLFIYRFVRTVRYGVDAKMKFGVVDKILLLASLGIIVSYLV